MFKDNPLFQKITKVGTPECTIACVILAVVVCVLLLTVGFGGLLLVALFVALALFLGGVKDKKAFMDKYFGKFLNKK